MLLLVCFPLVCFALMVCFALVCFALVRFAQGLGMLSLLSVVALCRDSPPLFYVFNFALLSSAHCPPYLSRDMRHFTARRQRDCFPLSHSVVALSNVVSESRTEERTDERADMRRLTRTALLGSSTSASGVKK